MNNKKIAILHRELEGTERVMKTTLEKMYGAHVELFDIENISDSDLSVFGPDIVLNRVYASVANRNYALIEKTLSLLSNMELNGVNCINSYQTSVYDYSKKDAADALLNQGVRSPRTIKYDSIDDALAESSDRDNLGFPLILKRNTGGRGKDVKRVDNLDEYQLAVHELFSNAVIEKYSGGFVVQEFLQSTKDYDCRLAIVDGKYAFAYGRTLVSLNDEKPWLASWSRGSKLIDYEPSVDEIALAVDASKAIGSLFNEVDMVFTQDGPAIIENNPTPNYDETDPKEYQRIISAVQTIYGATGK